MRNSLHRWILTVFVLAVSAAGQTQIDLRTQGKNVDFSGASSTKPIQTGTSLPGACSIGQTFLLTNASLGQNLYVCTASNVWTRQGGAAVASQLGDFAVTWTSSNVLTVGANCAAATPCNLRVGTTVFSYTQSCTATMSGSGSGAAYIYVTPAGTLTVGHNLTLTTSTGCVAQSGVTSFPAGSIPLYTWNAVSGAWDANGGLDYRAVLSSKPITTSTGLLVLDSPTSMTLSVDGAVVPTYLTASVVLDFPSIQNGACAAEQSFTLAGVAVGDGIAPGWPGTLEAGLVGIMRVSAPSTIAVRVCNLSGSTIDPASATYRVTVVKSFQ